MTKEFVIHHLCRKSKATMLLHFLIKVFLHVHLTVNYLHMHKCPCPPV